MNRLEALRRELQWRMCALNPVYFFLNFWYIQHPDQGAIKFELRDVQREILSIWLTERRTISLKARQIGWSTLVAGFAFWAAFFHSDRPIAMLSRRQDDARDLLSKSSFGYDRLPDWMQERGPKRLNRSVDSMRFANGSSIESFPSLRDPVRGRSMWLVVLDEWAFFDNPEDAWAAIEPAAEIGGRIIALSTAKGAGNFFHRFYENARAGLNGFRATFYPYSSVPEHDEDWYARKCMELPEWQLHQEHPRNELEAFIKSGDPVFDSDELLSIIPTIGTPGNVRPGPLDTQQFVPHDAGQWLVWKYPDLTGMEAYVIGADTSEGLEGGDYSCAHLLDSRGSLCARFHGRPDPDEFADELARMGELYGNALLGVERNNHGHAVLAVLRRQRYKNLYYDRTVGKKKVNKTDRYGWPTTVTTKPIMIDALVKVIREGQLDCPDQLTIEQLINFHRLPNGGMEGSPHDDAVMSLAIAFQMLQYVKRKSEPERDPLEEWNSLAALTKRLAHKEASHDRWRSPGGRRR